MSPRMSKPRRRILVALSVLLGSGLVGGGVYATRRILARRAADLAPIVMRLEPRPFELRISATGELQATDSMTVAVPPVPVNRLRLASVVPDGRHVAQGDVLVEFDPAELNLQALEYRSNFAAAEQKLSKGQLAVAAEKGDIVKDKTIAELELAKLTEFLPRDPTLYSKREMIEGELNRDYTEKKIVFAGARLELKGKVYSLDEAILLLERRQASTKIDQVQKALASLKLLAPAGGIVVYNDPGFYFGNPNLMPGRTVWNGMTLLNLVKPETMEAKCSVLEKDAGELRQGQPVSLTLDPFPARAYTGKVKSVDKVARALDRGSPVKYFQILVSLDATDRSLMHPGLKLKAQVLAGSLTGVLVVPRTALARQEDGFTAFVQKSPGVFEPRPVTLGLGDLVQVVVTDGLKPGEMLALNPPDVSSARSEPGSRATKGVGP
jgi:multidrug efflux pump subunit AcrA (membrane-fusion protein)